jgi:dGTPase
MRLNWEQLLSFKRVSEFGPCQVNTARLSQYEDPRSPFERDYDQIVFSYPFRRLQDKTQVIPFPKFDFVHTRLTHTLEVASIGRSLGKLAAKNIFKELGEEKITQLEICPSDIGALVAAACLAHDIGNPPFGHSGEDAISYYFKLDEANLCPWITTDAGIDNGNDTFTYQYENGNIVTLTAQEVFENTKKWHDLIKFEGNANGFRILTLNCDKGINPTAALLGTFSKYPCESFLINDPFITFPRKEKPISQQKHGFFFEQRQLFNKVASELGLCPLGDIHELDIAYHRHPLAFLMEAADDIAYRMIDFEDGIRLNLIDFTKHYSLFKSKEDKASKDSDRKVKVSPYDILMNIATVDKEFDISEVRDKPEKEQIVYLRGFVINTLTHEAFKVFDRNYEDIMNCGFETSLIDTIGDQVVVENLFMMRSLIEEFVYSYAPVLENEAAGFDVLGRLIDDFAITTNICISCGDEETEKQKKIRSLIPEEYQPKNEVVPQIVNFSEQYRRILKILDFTSGMTDSYAINKFKKIHGIEIAQ